MSANKRFSWRKVSAEARLLRRHVDSILKENADARLVVYGDFNDTRATPAIKQITGKYNDPTYLTAIPANQVEQSVLHNAGARPWDRDMDDIRLIADVGEGRGEIVNSENDLKGYPVQNVTTIQTPMAMLRTQKDSRPSQAMGPSSARPTPME